MNTVCTFRRPGLKPPLSLLAGALLVLATGALPLQARDAPAPAGALGVFDITDAQLDPGFWVKRLQEPDGVVMDATAIAAQNARLRELDPTIHDLAALPATLARADIAGRIGKLSTRPTRAMFDVEGRPVPDATLDAMVDSLALDAIPEQQAVRYGLVVQRADLRTFPTMLRIFSSQGETDIDRLQESAEFPGTPVAVLHESRDGQWWFVLSPRYAAWMEKKHVALGDRETVLAYPGKAPYRVVTGAAVRTVYARERPELSELQLDMGTRVPLADVPGAAQVNGQHPYTSHVLQLPVRAADGSLSFAPALLQKIADTSPGYLPLTRANIIRQSFKFLGERYGWGHAYNGRDCSGFVSEVYRSVGVELPRNTRDQAVSAALQHTLFSEKDGREARMAAVRTLDVGDLVYIPGHVMMVIGHIDGRPYVIHDTNGGGYLDAGGTLRTYGLNGVSVTPLLPLMFNARERYVDRITSIVRIRPTSAQGTATRP
jgi:cell wall-associated NlpC family hydrolase